MFRSNQPIHPRMDIGVTGPCCPLPLTWEVDPPWDPLPLLATVRLGMGHLGSEGQDGTEPGCWDGAGGWVGLGDAAMGATGLWFVQWRLARGLCPHTVPGWDPTPKEGALQRGCGCVSMLLPTCCLRASSSPPCSSLPHPCQGLPWIGVGCFPPAVGSELSSSAPAGAFGGTTEFCSRSDCPCLPVTLRLGLPAVS